MRKRHTWKGAILGAGLALVASFLPADAQSTNHKGDTQKPVVSTYDKRPDPSGDNQKLDAVRYDQNNADNDVSSTSSADEQKPVVNTYDKRPDPQGDAQKLDAVRYEQNNDANDGRPSELRMRVLEGSVEE